MKTLKEMLAAENPTEIERAVQAAYWAGQSDMRGEVTEDVGKSVSNFTFGRYKNIERRAIDAAISTGLINKNAKAFGGYGDSGKSEVAEFLEWDFDL